MFDLSEGWHYDLNGGTRDAGPIAERYVHKTEADFAVEGSAGIHRDFYNPETLEYWQDNLGSILEAGGMEIPSYNLEGVDIVLTAVWTPMEWAISYEELDGVTGYTNGEEVRDDNPNTAAYTVESELSFTHDPLRPGYTFTGWISEAENPSPLLNNPHRFAENPIEAGYADHRMTGHVTFTATWTPILLDMTFVSWDGSAIGAVQTVPWGSDAAAPAPPARDGYSFTGWSRAFTNVTENITVQALYTVNPDADPAPAVTAEPAAPPAVPAGPAAAPVPPPAAEVLAEPEVPLAEPAAQAEPEPVPLAEVIDEPETPLAGASWALVNLMLAILALAIGVLLLAGMLRRSGFASRGWRILGIVAGIASPIVFLLTENLQNPMGVIDGWTLPMAVITAIQRMAMMVMRVTRTKQENEDTTAE